jgi:EAL domain-containing protein (putative c-di-GMP-specific phosphodiesterase class I)
MYQAKAAGRNTYRFYQQSMQDIVDTKLNIERNLGMAISQGELSLHYQPQHADAKTVVAVEALLRWDSYNLGHIPPAKFIPVAEESGLILTIGQWVIEKACEQIISWDQQKIKVPLVAINISAKQFHQANFASNLIYIVLGYNINPNRIMLEVTENIFLGKFEDIKDKMHVLKKEGFKFSIDDFGSGQSSLTYLKGLPFDQLKVDQSFIRGFLNQPTDVAIVKAIASVAKSLKLDLIAEGVETEEHLAFLSDFGCDGYQGNYFSQPLAIEQLDRYIRSFITIKG